MRLAAIGGPDSVEAMGRLPGNILAKGLDKAMNMIDWRQAGGETVFAVPMDPD